MDNTAKKEKPPIRASISYMPKAIANPIGSMGGQLVLMLFGSPFMAIGAYLAGSYFKVFPFDTVKSNVPMEVLALVGAVFFLAGLSIFYRGGVGLFYANKFKALKWRFPDSPWKWDTNWNEKGVFNSSGKGIVHHLFGLILVLGLFSPFFYFMLKQDHFPTVAKIVVVALFSLFFFIAIYNLFKNLKYKNVKCLYGTFPFQLAQLAQVEVHGLPGSSVINQGSVELRCIYTKTITQRSGGKTETKRIYESLWESIIPLNKHEVHNGVLRLNLELPADKDLTTDLTIAEFRFWELRVKADTKGIDYDFGFLMPIYR